MKLLFSLFGIVVVLAAISEASADPRKKVGGASSVDDLKSVEKELNASLAKLAAGDGPNYKLGKVYSATRQVVSGITYNIVADLVDKDDKTKKCNVNIWSRKWLPNGVKVTFECDGEPKLIKKYST